METLYHAAHTLANGGGGGVNKVYRSGTFVLTFLDCTAANFDTVVYYFPQL
jgi:hypothetical protein